MKLFDGKETFFLGCLIALCATFLLYYQKIDPDQWVWAIGFAMSGYTLRTVTKKVQDAKVESAKKTNGVTAP